MSALHGELVELAAPVAGRDAPLVADWLSSSHALRSSGGPQFLTPAEADELVSSAAGWLLVHASETGLPIGALTWTANGPTGSYAIQYVVGVPEAWRDGPGREAVELLLDHLFLSLAAHRVQLVTGLFDELAVDAVVTCGFVVEGVLRDYYYLDGGYEDAVICSLLRAEHGQGSGTDRPRTESVPAEDKARARRLLTEYLTRHPLDPLVRIAPDERSSSAP
ncbi:GNAT family protein [Streptomyces sp. NPDC048057]|uniref:GNAT family N-acetyltransferase n=1 Tax=Streptomyces sp. NPDC048057 TaxID=3155628 RepID=UPI0033FF3803